MSKITSQTSERIKETAKLRVEGLTWAEIAKRYGYKNESSACTMLTQEHSQEWRVAYEYARVDYLDGIEIGAIERQQVLSRQSENLSVAQAATHSLLAHCAKLRAMQVRITGKVEHEYGGSMELNFADMTPEQLDAEIRAIADCVED